ncbi:MAG TPA: class I SAM-dependent methyltransferase [Clostridia bacterium]|nr:class I SAM-dependent methyltransferase [Clostridia bacterium]
MKSRNNAEKHIGIFNFIAPIYGLFYSFQKGLYNRALGKARAKLDLSAYKTVIDVGCGTGALCSVLNQRGFSVTGVDPAEKMLAVARGKRENQGISFIKASATDRLPFDRKTFDVSIASYVAHGLEAHEREKMYLEMGRVTKHFVIIHDYNDRGSPLASIVERLEGGDYFNFIKSAKSELEGIFHDVQVFDVFAHAAWYVCVPGSLGPKESPGS